MKFLISIFACLGAASYALNTPVIDEFKQLIKEKFEFCVNDANASPADVETLMKKTIPESHEGKCVLFCMHKKCHLQNEDGSLNVEGALTGLDKFKSAAPDLYQKLVVTVNGCGSSVASDPDPCVYAANLAACLISAQQTNGIGMVLIK